MAPGQAILGRSGDFRCAVWNRLRNSFQSLWRGIVLDPQVAQRYFYDSKAVWFSILKGTPMTNWETPSFEEIDMSAEIGSYQGEDDNGL